MKLIVQELRDFIAMASLIRPNTLMPITEYIKFTPGLITKSSLQSFVVAKINCNQSFLIEEKVLNNFIKYTKDDEIEVKISGNSVVLKDSQGSSKSATEPIENFPTNTTPEGERFYIDEHIRAAIKIAAQLPNDDTSDERLKSVFVCCGCVAATDNYVTYVKLFDSLPECVLSKEVAGIVCNLDHLYFTDNDSYTHFESEDMFFGFIKHEVKPFDFKVFIKDLPGSFIGINKTELAKVNDMCINNTSSSFFVNTIQAFNKKANISTIDKNYERELVRDIDCEGSIPEFTYNPRIMNKLLKAIPELSVTIYHDENRLVITDQSKTFQSFIQKTIP